MVLNSTGWRRVVAALAAAVAGLTANAEAPAETRMADVRRDASVDAVAAVLPSVVNIGTRKWVERELPYERMLRQFYGDPRSAGAAPRDPIYARGSGVVVDEDGYVLTNTHVVADADDIWVQFFDGSEAIPAERVVLSKAKDVAMLKLKPKTPRKFKTVPFARDDDLLLGETVLALGNPFGLGGSVARGILSSKSRRPPSTLAAGQQLEIGDWLQTDAAINPGNSGGPLVNLRGELIGLNVAVFNPSVGQGIGFAIPVRQINDALAEMLAGEFIKGFWFGARLSASTQPLRVQSVQPGSPAAQAGLQKGDAVLQVNGRDLGSLLEFNEQLTLAADQRDVTLKIRRETEAKTLSLRLIDERAFFNNDLLRRRIGLAVHAVPAGGLLVDTVERGSPAAQAELRPGMLILTVDGQRAGSLVQLAHDTHAKPRGAELQFGVLVAERAGNFIRRYEAEVTLKTR